MLLASELKLKAEFQEEEHASTTPTESIICPCLTMSPVSHSHSASPPTQPSNLFTLKFFPNLHRAIGGPSCPGATADLPASKLPHTATTSKIDDQHSHSFIHCKINLLNFQVDGVLLASEYTLQLPTSQYVLSFKNVLIRSQNPITGDHLSLIACEGASSVKL